MLNWEKKEKEKEEGVIKLGGRSRCPRTENGTKPQGGLELGTRKSSGTGSLSPALRDMDLLTSEPQFILSVSASHPPNLLLPTSPLVGTLCFSRSTVQMATPASLQCQQRLSPCSGPDSQGRDGIEQAWCRCHRSRL